MPLLSIITPCLNSKKYLPAMVDSVQAQIDQDLELIIVDGGSTDGTIDFLRTLNCVRWISEKDEGQSDALNKAIKMARGEIICWLNSDDRLSSRNSTLIIKNAFSKIGQFGLIYGGFNIIDEDNNVTKTIIPPDFNIWDELSHNMVSPTAVCWKKECSEIIGLFDNELHYAMDYDYWLKLCVKTKIGKIDDIIADFRICQGTKTYEHQEHFRREAALVVTRFLEGPGQYLVSEPEREYLVNLHQWRASVAYYLKGLTNPAREFAFSCEKGQFFNKHTRVMTETLIHMIVNQGVDTETEGISTQLIISDLLKQGYIDKKKARVVLAATQASIALNAYNNADIANGNKYAIACVRNNVKWLINPGILSILMRTLLHR